MRGKAPLVAALIGAAVIVLGLWGVSLVLWVRRSPAPGTVQSPPIQRPVVTQSGTVILPQAPVKAPSPPAISNQDQGLLADELGSQDPQAQRKAVLRMRAMAISDPRSLAIGLPKWVDPLIADKDYREVENFALESILERAFDPPVVQAAQRGRVLALMGEGNYSQALMEAKSYYNVAGLGDTAGAVALLAQIWNKTGQAATAARFQAEQVAAKNDSTNPLRAVHVDAAQYRDAIYELQNHRNGRGQYSYGNLLGQGELLLLADRPSEAKKCFEQACQEATRERDVRLAVEGVACSIRAQGGSIAAADAFLSALTRNPSVMRAKLTAARGPSLQDVILAAQQLTPGASDPDDVNVPSTPTVINPNATMENDRRFVMSVCADLRGGLWVGTEGGGVERFDPAAPQGHQWTQFTTKDGLGDDYGYAIACDHQGRIWVGHLNHGVSVYNGQHWQNYDVVGGIDSPDSLSGPLGERVFAITVCPTNGDVWMATNCGLARYSPSQKTWRYYTRANGLPSDQANSIAFDAAGNIYVGTQCNGIAMANADDGYATWRVATGPNRLPTDPFGPGLPSNLINDVLVAKNGTVYAATDAGLAWSKDQGQSWQYVRGMDWADKVRGLYGGPPKGWKARPGAALAEDYVTCVYELGQAALCAGYRQRGLQEFSLKVNKLSVVSQLLPNYYVTSLAMLPDGDLAVGTYGDGTAFVHSAAPLKPVAARTFGSARFPASARPPDLAYLNQELNEMANVPPLTKASVPLVVPLDDDWRTEGDWLGRYGRYLALLAAMEQPAPMGYDQLYPYVWGAAPEDDDVSWSVGLGGHHVAGDFVRFWITRLFTDDPRVLEIPPVYLDQCIRQKLTTASESRRQGEWDDHGEQYSTTYDGPDIYLQLTIPKGLYVLSFYDLNDGGHMPGHLGYRNRYRDFRLVIKNHSDDGLDREPTLASSRVVDFWAGVYKCFAVQGPADLTVRVSRNYSLNAIFTAMMLDLPNQRAVGYFFSAKQWQLAQANSAKQRAMWLVAWSKSHRWRPGSFGPFATETMAANGLMRRLNDMRDWNPRWWAIHRKETATLLARWCAAGTRSQSSSQLTELKSAAFYNCGLYADSEQCQATLHRTTARQIERNLRWDGAAVDYSGRGYEAIRAHLAAHRKQETD
jgi:hypothetical protein